MTIKGSCLCGTVTYEVDGALGMTGHCHCSICRKSHGAAYATWAFIDPDKFRWTSGADSLAGYPSSPGRERLFCKHCGSPLVATHDGKVAEVVVGTVDGSPDVQLSGHVFVGYKAPWHEITDGLPQHHEWPPGMAV